MNVFDFFGGWKPFFFFGGGRGMVFIIWEESRVD